MEARLLAIIAIKGVKIKRHLQDFWRYFIKENCYSYRKLHYSKLNEDGEVTLLSREIYKINGVEIAKKDLSNKQLRIFQNIGKISFFEKLFKLKSRGPNIEIRYIDGKYIDKIKIDQKEVKLSDLDSEMVDKVMRLSRE